MGPPFSAVWGLNRGEFLRHSISGPRVPNLDAWQGFLRLRMSAWVSVCEVYCVWRMELFTCGAKASDCWEEADKGSESSLSKPGTSWNQCFWMEISHEELAWVLYNRYRPCVIRHPQPVDHPDEQPLRGLKWTDPLNQNLDWRCLLLGKGLHFPIHLDPWPICLQLLVFCLQTPYLSASTEYLMTFPRSNALQIIIWLSISGSARLP